jgi:hypothetical protein
MVMWGTRNRHLSIQREMPAAVKMLMVSVAHEIGYASIDEEAGVINKSGYPPPPPWWSNHQLGLGSVGRSHPERRGE